MESLKKNDIEILLNHSKTRKVINPVNKEANKRKLFLPFKCQIFSEEFTSLQEQTQYVFADDKETEKILPDIINNNVQKVVKGLKNSKEEKFFFKKKNIGVVFSGGPAPGGHNVIAGIFDAAKKANSESKIFGFLFGPDGILESKYIELTKEIIDDYRNIGGFTMIKTGRTKIDSNEKMDFAKKTCKELNLDALVIIGGDDSNTNAAFLAQEFKKTGIQVIGVPKTIDGDIQVKTQDSQVLCAISFGFHSAARAFSNNISNLCTDTGSDAKYWHICKVMGRVASHLALEAALQTHANLTLIGEELADYVDKERLKDAEKKGVIDYTAFGITLRHLSRVICDVIMKRAANGKNYGIMILPEGVLEFVNEIQIFIIKLNTIIGDYNHIHDIDFHEAFPNLNSKLDYLRKFARGISDKGTSPIWNSRDDELFNDLPEFFQKGLLVERDSHGNFQFSQIKTEKIIMDMVKSYLNVSKEKGTYKVGIENDYFINTLKQENLDPDVFRDVIFSQDSKNNQYLLVKKSIFSKKTLKQALLKSNLIKKEEKVPKAIMQIFNKSVPKFKTQTYFYGYDGRGNDPTQFDCNYAYNLGLTAFSLIANGATGQMAAIKNLEYEFSKWEPIGIPIAKLIHIEERKGKLAHVIEKSIVDINSNAFRIVKALREEWEGANPYKDQYRKPAPIQLKDNNEDDMPITLILNSIKF